ncbi:MAG: hypothetical protein KDJ36_19275, partial [Hyphomicrobiaceae bacterium]|nr:hypothetical protein [Hyphomicrobiaceae bacterium]
MRVTDEMVETIAKWLHDEVEWPEYNYPERSWPEHEGDAGQRGDGWLKIVPPDVCEQFRDIARRLPIEAALAVEGTEAEAEPVAWTQPSCLSEVAVGNGGYIWGKRDMADVREFIAATGGSNIPDDIPLYTIPPAGIREAPVKRAIGNGMAIAAGIVMKCWGDTVTAGEILG